MDLLGMVVTGWGTDRNPKGTQAEVRSLTLVESLTMKGIITWNGSIYGRKSKKSQKKSFFKEKVCCVLRAHFLVFQNRRESAPACVTLLFFYFYFFSVFNF